MNYIKTDTESICMEIDEKSAETMSKYINQQQYHKSINIGIQLSNLYKIHFNITIIYRTNP